jgi:hypothetical protein
MNRLAIPHVNIFSQRYASRLKSSGNAEKDDSKRKRKCTKNSIKEAKSVIANDAALPPKQVERKQFRSIMHTKSHLLKAEVAGNESSEVLPLSVQRRMPQDPKRQ